MQSEPNLNILAVDDILHEDATLAAEIPESSSRIQNFEVEDFPPPHRFHRNKIPGCKITFLSSQHLEVQKQSHLASYRMQLGYLLHQESSSYAGSMPSFTIDELRKISTAASRP